jgi:hypothetical protein
MASSTKRMMSARSASRHGMLFGTAVSASAARAPSSGVSAAARLAAGAVAAPSARICFLRLLCQSSWPCEQGCPFRLSGSVAALLPSLATDQSLEQPSCSCPYAGHLGRGPAGPWPAMKQVQTLKMTWQARTHTCRRLRCPGSPLLPAAPAGLKAGSSASE